MESSHRAVLDLVVFGARRLDLCDMRLRPAAERRQRIPQGLAESGEGVIHARRHLVRSRARDDPVALEVAQGVGQDLAADAVDGLARSSPKRIGCRG